MKKLYEIGITWEAKTESGRIGKIWLEDRYKIHRKYYEVWRWSVIWDDGSDYKSDTRSSYKGAVNEIPIYNGIGNKPIRFKRVKTLDK